MAVADALCRAGIDDLVVRHLFSVGLVPAGTQLAGYHGRRKTIPQFPHGFAKGEPMGKLGWSKERLCSHSVVTPTGQSPTEVMIEFSEQEPLKADRPIDAPTTAREPEYPWQTPDIPTTIRLKQPPPRQRLT